MTIEEIKSSADVFLRPVDVAPILGCDAQAIRDVAKKTPERLGFPVTVIGTRTRIPRKAFLKWLGEDMG